MRFISAGISWNTIDKTHVVLSTSRYDDNISRADSFLRVDHASVQRASKRYFRDVRFCH